MIVEATTPYPWPCDHGLTPASTALVICGAGPCWTGRTPTDRPTEANLLALRELATEVDLMTVLIDHDSATDRPVRELPPEVCSPLTPLAGERVVVAAGSDGFYGSSLDPVLHRAGRTHLLFAGFGFETAVHSTLRRANDRGYECLTVADACVSIDRSLRPGSISSIEISGGIFGAVGQTADVVAAFRQWAIDQDAHTGTPPSGTNTPHDKDSS